MQLKIFKPLWGHVGDFELACQQAVAAGFNGIEGQLPAEAAQQKRYRELLDRYQLEFIAEICTAGSYVPDCSASLSDHLDCLRRQLALAEQLTPLFVTCLGGCDAWQESTSATFFEEAMKLAGEFATEISFETHRGRSLFNPWVTHRICQLLPEINLTCDFSHWCVVCERLLVGEEEVLRDILPHAFHIHARVGYDQGPQVPDPSAPRYKEALEQHWAWWQTIWELQRETERAATTMTPEFGPDGYQAIDVKTDQPIGDLWEINQWMAADARSRFASANTKSLEAS